MIQALFISTILPDCSPICLVTRLRTLYVPPQYGNSSASQCMPRFRLLVVTVLSISSCDFTRTSSPGCRFRLEVGVGSPSGIRPGVLGKRVPPHSGFTWLYSQRMAGPTPIPECMMPKYDQYANAARIRLKGTLPER